MYKNDSIVMIKSVSFALEIIKTTRDIMKEKQEYVLSKQLLRSGTAIGALIKEAEHAQSKADFLHKMNVALKEANESVYWLYLLKESEFLVLEKWMVLDLRNMELVRILAKIVKTTKLSLAQKKEMKIN